MQELKELNMPKANFVVNFSDLPLTDVLLVLPKYQG